jgi:hypothetical protein
MHQEIKGKGKKKKLIKERYSKSHNLILHLPHNLEKHTRNQKKKLLKY